MDVKSNEVVQVRKYCSKCEKKTVAIYNINILMDCCKNCETAFPLPVVDNRNIEVGDKVKKRLGYLSSGFYNFLFKDEDQVFTVAKTYTDGYGDANVIVLKENCGPGELIPFHQFWGAKGFTLVNK